MTKNEIYNKLIAMKTENVNVSKTLTKSAKLTDYAHLVRKGLHCGESVDIWTDAFQAAVNENEVVIIPPSDVPYYTDTTVILPSDRRIEAYGATVQLIDSATLLLLRNASIANGTHMPIKDVPKNRNITVCGGTWAESHKIKAGYGKSGKLDEEYTYRGVSACFYFGNMEGLNLLDLHFVRAGGFSVQVGNISNAVFENIEFTGCFADGLHINGNCENIYAYNIRGEVGDDLVALNMYDWLNSSVNFGPTKCIWLEKLDQFESSIYKSLRILPGTYTFGDGSVVDCSLTDAVIKNVRGIKTFKLYFQSHSYRYAFEDPESGSIGSADNIYFEDIKADLTPIDMLPEYADSHPVKGTCAVFELGSNIGNVYFENIDITLHRDAYPLSYVACIGPKSARKGGLEYFNPDMSSHAEKLEFSTIRVNGEIVTDIGEFVRQIVFDDIYSDGKSSGKGSIDKIILK